MIQKSQSKEYEDRINKVEYFILKNLKEELSLEKLASIANYSPFHFQKIFKQVLGESPKQHIIRLRLEDASHSMMIYRNKPIMEIALDHGFSSPSTFARAFKNYFGFSAEEFKNFSPRDKITMRMFANSRKYTENTCYDFLNIPYDVKFWKKNLKVTVSRIVSNHLIFVNAPLSDTLKIQEGFKKVLQFAEAHDLHIDQTKFIGIIHPHRVLYSAAVIINNHQKLPGYVGEGDIKAGKYAVFKIKGNALQTFHGIHAFFELWLPYSGYQIVDPFCFEILSKNPGNTPYQKIEREIYISIEAS
jgi:AraC family transcriptional regulator